jgi:hypothetical protein
MQPKLGGRCIGARAQWAHLVLGVDLGQLDRLLEDAVNLLQGDGLLPVIEGARHEDVVRSMLPRGLLARAEPKRAAMLTMKRYICPCRRKNSVQSGMAGM